MELLREIRSLTWDQAMSLEEKALAGDEASVKKFAWYSIWRKLKRDSHLTPEQREQAFKELVKRVNFNVIFEGRASG